MHLHSEWLASNYKPPGYELCLLPSPNSKPLDWDDPFIIFRNYIHWFNQTTQRIIFLCKNIFDNFLLGPLGKLSLLYLPVRNPSTRGEYDSTFMSNSLHTFSNPFSREYRYKKRKLDLIGKQGNFTFRELGMHSPDCINTIVACIDSFHKALFIILSQPIPILFIRKMNMIKINRLLSTIQPFHTILEGIDHTLWLRAEW